MALSSNLRRLIAPELILQLTEIKNHLRVKRFLDKSIKERNEINLNMLVFKH